MLSVMQLLVQCQAMLLHACTALQECCSKSTPHSLAMWLKISSEATTIFSTSALKELGKGWSWFLSHQDCKNEVYNADTCSSQITIKMSNSNETLLTTSVSILDGSNYLVWQAQMKAWLRSKGLWQIMSGNEKKFPKAADTETVTIQQANYKAHMEWDNKGDQAYGLILL